MSSTGPTDRTRRPHQAPPDHEPAAIAPGLAPADERLRILVVDDEPTLRRVIGQVLRMDGHDVSEVASAEEALDAFREQPYPLVITDIIMGAMSGLELLAEIKKQQPETLVVIMTSQASIEAATMALRQGAYDFLIKPFDDLFLISAVAKRAAEPLRLLRRNLLLMQQLEMYAGELERKNLDLKHAADKDWLTGLYSRRFLRQALDNEISRAMRHKHDLSLIILDVDHFKTYNDTHGHLAGDDVLREVGRILQSTTRAEDLCARYGGEEFVVLMPEADRRSAAATAERIRKQVEEHPFLGGETQPGGALTVSLGVASFPADDPNGEALIAHADAALYMAKDKGRNRVVTG